MQTALNPEPRKSAPISERRNFIRYEIAADVTAVNSVNCLTATATNISVFGLRLFSATPVYPTAPLRVYFRKFRSMVIVGKVVWVLNTIDDLGMSGYQIGLKIDRIIRPDSEAAGVAARTQCLQDVLLALKQEEEVEV